ncbi:cupin domain-containing protein [Roseibium sediminis]|uniref:cupin domain-containing protein n=1 Tax=Roseibium sediminis TaxID=1775174 RepID=UPI00123D2D39|nr:cupin domain-containing protein [Roseibium sediminis]
MQIHADLTKRAVVNTISQDWVPSPMSGVESQLLESDDRETERATSLVRFAPGSRFVTETHDMSEEFLVLDGVYSDERGDFQKGMYVRNPPGSEFISSSTPGAIIMVKRHRTHPKYKQQVHVDTEDPIGWQIGRIGEKVLPLFADSRETVSMLDWEPGCSFATQTLSGGAEYLVLEGRFQDEESSYPSGTWLRLPAGSQQTIRSISGARVWRKLGHLMIPNA